MKIIIVGATSTIGKGVVKELSPRHEIISASYQSCDIQVDMSDSTSIKTMYEQAGAFDALIVAAGKVHFEELTKMTEEEFHIGLNNKLMGQVNLVRIGLDYINEKGSFTLTSGITNQSPIRLGASAAMVCGALDSFVKAAAIEMPNGTRINIISPTMLTESKDAYGPYFPGFESVPAARVALAYAKSVEGLQTGQLYKVGY